MLLSLLWLTYNFYGGRNATIKKSGHKMHGMASYATFFWVSLTNNLTLKIYHRMTSKEQQFQRQGRKLNMILAFNKILLFVPETGG